MRIVLATDHAGFELKEAIKEYLVAENVDVEDFGAYEYTPDDDYPAIIATAALAVSEDPENTRGIVLGGSGQGEAIVANRFKNVRSIVYYGDAHEVKNAPVLSFFGTADEHEPFEIVSLSREHNDSNVLALGARFLSVEQAIGAVIVWLSTPYSEEVRHERRIQQIEALYVEYDNDTDV